MTYWKQFGEVISEYNKYIHGDGVDGSDATERLQMIQNKFNEYLDSIRNNPELYNSAIEYVNERSKQDVVLGLIQQQTQSELDSIFRNYFGESRKYKVLPASSFSAKTNIIGESDLDFNVPIEDFNNKPTDNSALGILLQQHKYEFKELRTPNTPDAHYVYVKIVKGECGDVEIEVKLRDLSAYMSLIYKIHDYLDNKADPNAKMIITYIKANLKPLSVHYTNFKQLYYEWANSHIEPASTKMMFLSLIHISYINCSN